MFFRTQLHKCIRVAGPMTDRFGQKPLFSCALLGYLLLNIIFHISHHYSQSFSDNRWDPYPVERCENAKNSQKWPWRCSTDGKMSQDQHL